MNEGEWSSRLGIPGQPAEAEELMVMRDIVLARLTGARVHFQHLSTAGSVAMVRAARAAGLPVTAEATPHHFTLTDECCASFDPVFKVNPPLRTVADVAAVKAWLTALDAIATDPPTPPPEGAAVRPGPARMLGLRLPSPRHHRVDLPIGPSSPSCRGSRRHRRSPTATAARSSRGEANLCVIDPRPGGWWSRTAY
jgi:dihydroorotase